MKKTDELKIMNNVQLKVKLDSVNAEYVGKEAKIVVSGVAKFQFYRNGQMNVRSVPYQAYGQTALTLQSAGENSIHVISGVLNVYPPSDKNPSHSLLLTINKTLPIGMAQAPVKPQAAPQPKKVEGKEKIPF